MKVFLTMLSIVLGVSAQSIEIFVQNDKASYAVGDTVVTAVVISIPKGFHLYANPLGPGVGKPLSISIGQNSKIKWLDGFAEKPQKYVQDNDNWVWQWEERAHIFVRGVVVSKAKGKVDLAINVNGLICKEACIPQKKTIPVSIVLGSKGAKQFTSTLNSAQKTAVSFPVVFASKSSK